MQILGKRSKVLLIAVAIVMLVAIGVSFAAWDSMSTVKAVSGDLSTYANAKVGDIVEFGNYYQSKSELDKKDPITWIVVDKDERTGQLTLFSEKILACGSYFGNYYDDGTGYNWHYNNGSIAEVAENTYNQAYVDSTVRAYLNNLERLDLGGDGFASGIGYVPSKFNSTKTTGLLSSIGFSNKRYWTELNYEIPTDKALVEAGNKGLVKRLDSTTEIYYQRPIDNDEYLKRPATKGFYDEAFSIDEKAMIIPKVIAGYTGFRWPDEANSVDSLSFVEGSVDKVWLPSATELNVAKGLDWNGDANDLWTNPSDEAGSTVFQHFKNLEGEKLKNALIATRTELASDGMAGNYSIPVYDKESAKVKSKISTVKNTSENYWTRSMVPYWCHTMRIIDEQGLFNYLSTHNSYVGVRPCVIIKY